MNTSKWVLDSSRRRLPFQILWLILDRVAILNFRNYSTKISSKLDFKVRISLFLVFLDNRCELELRTATTKFLIFQA
jgi:hypothetical protein